MRYDAASNAWADAALAQQPAVLLEVIAPVGGSPRSNRPPLWQLLPSDAGLEHEHNPGQRGPIINGPASGEPIPPGRTSRQQRSDRTHSESAQLRPR